MEGEARSVCGAVVCGAMVGRGVARRVGTAVALGVGLGDGRGVGRGVGLGTGAGFTVTLGPPRFGSLPLALAWKFTSHVPAGSLAVPRYRPSSGMPETRVNGMTTLPAMAVTLVGALPCALWKVTLNAKVVLVVPPTGVTAGFSSWFGGAATTGPRSPSTMEPASIAAALVASTARPPIVPRAAPGPMRRC